MNNDTKPDKRLRKQIYKSTNISAVNYTHLSSIHIFHHVEVLLVAAVFSAPAPGVLHDVVGALIAASSSSVVHSAALIAPALLDVGVIAAAPASPGLSLTPAINALDGVAAAVPACHWGHSTNNNRSSWWNSSCPCSTWNSSCHTSFNCISWPLRKCSTSPRFWKHPRNPLIK